MKKTEAFDIITDYTDSLNKMMPGGGRLFLTDGLYVGMGSTPDEFSRKSDCLIGVRGLGFKTTENGELRYPIYKKGAERLFRIDSVDDLLVTTVLVSCGHEFCHAVQQENEFHGKTDDKKRAKYMAINFVACMDNEGYYVNFGNLFQNPRDIDAEKTGIDLAYTYLSNHLGEEKAQQMIIDYVNYRTDENHTYYFNCPKLGFESVDQIDQMFDEAFEASKNGKRLYLTGTAAMRHHDMNAKFLDDRHDDYAQACVKVMSDYHGEEKDKMMAAVSLKQDPSYARYVKGLIKPEELSMQNVFGPYFTEEQNQRFFGKHQLSHEDRMKMLDESGVSESAEAAMNANRQKDNGDPFEK